MSEEDKELLRLAAKAIGGVYDDCGAISTTGGFEYVQWEPIESDGDALRLAMSLELGVACKRQSDPHEKNRSVVTSPYRANQLRIVEVHKGDPEAATRRAIVRAAAEIGKSMQKGAGDE